MLRFDRKQQNSVKQLSFNKKKIKKKTKKKRGRWNFQGSPQAATSLSLSPQCALKPARATP